MSVESCCNVVVKQKARKLLKRQTIAVLEADHPRRDKTTKVSCGVASQMSQVSLKSVQGFQVQEG